MLKFKSVNHLTKRPYACSHGILDAWIFDPWIADPCGHEHFRVSLLDSISVPYDLVRLAVVCDSVDAFAEAVSRQYRLFPSGFNSLNGLVVKEEVRRLLAILKSHRIVLVKVIAIN